MIFLEGTKTRKKALLIFGILSIIFLVSFSLTITVFSPFRQQPGKGIFPVVEKEAEEESPETPQKEGLEEKKVSEEPEESQPEPKVYAVSIGDIAKTELLRLTTWTDGAVSMDVPVNWNIYTGGQCATKSILARDPSTELKQVFYFSEAGPVYTSQESKQRDQNYVAMGGNKLSYFESPVVNPLTAENYLKNFGAFAITSLFQQAFPEVPVMTDIKIISKKEITDKPHYVTDGKLIRAEFKQGGKSGEGYFHIITADLGMGFGYGMMFVGMTAPKGLLDLITPSLKKSLESYVISQEYVSACLQAQNKAAAGILKAGRILSQSSDTIMEVWENKLESEQRMSEKYSDAILGSSRLYNPQTDEVYVVTPEFYDFYQIHNTEFEKNYLQEMPNDKWGHAPLNGAEYIY